MSSWGAFLFLLLNSILDLRFRRISLLSAAAAGAFGIIAAVLIRHVPIPSLAAALLPGVGLMLLSGCSRGAIGLGDGIAVMVLGLYVTPSGMLAVLTCSFFFLAAGGGISLLIKKKKHMTLPFLPFLLVGYLCVALMERGGI